jgi:murein L,D-transpeptidase YafK
VQEVNVTAVVRWMGRAAGVLVLLSATSGVADEQVASLSSSSNGSHGAPPGQVIEIWKGERKMALREGDVVIKEFRVSLGGAPTHGKELQGDNRTPVGRYYVSERNAASRFHRFLGISYPNAEDAERAYQRRLIGPSQWADIFFANLRGDAPPPYTVLGGKVGIHGYGGRPYLPIDWTQGCVAVSDPEIEFLFDRVAVGTPVLINE